MIVDELLRLCSGKEIKTAATSDVLDLKQPYPNLGSLTPPFYVIVQPAAASGAGTVKFTIQDSADGTTFADCMVCTVSVADMKGALALPLPVKHRRYLRLTTTPTAETGSTLGGTFGAVLNNVYDLERLTKVEGYDIAPSVD